jgi:hypothetical protein
MAKKKQTKVTPAPPQNDTELLSQGILKNPEGCNLKDHPVTKYKERFPLA